MFPNMLQFDEQGGIKGRKIKRKKGKGKKGAGKSKKRSGAKKATGGAANPGRTQGVDEVTEEFLLKSPTVPITDKIKVIGPD